MSVYFLLALKTLPCTNILAFKADTTSVFHPIIYNPHIHVKCNYAIVL